VARRAGTKMAGPALRGSVTIRTDGERLASPTLNTVDNSRTGLKLVENLLDALLQQDCDSHPSTNSTCGTVRRPVPSPDGRCRNAP